MASGKRPRSPSPQLSIEQLQPSDDEDDAPETVAVGTKGTFLFEDEFGKWYSVPGYSKEKLRGSDQGYVQIWHPKGGLGNPTLGSNDGAYKRIKFCGKRLKVHDLLCTIWHGIKNNSSLTAQHGLGGPSDNRKCNLLGWATKSEQRTDHRTKDKCRRDSRSITVWKRSESREQATNYESAAAACRATGVNHLDKVANGTIQQSKGYVAEWLPPKETQEDLQGEEWRKVGERLMVSNMGRACLKHNRADKWGLKFTPVPTRGACYAAVGLDGRQVDFHRVVYTAFKDDLNGRTVDHVNGDRRDNRLDNLRPATHVEQRANQIRLSTNLINNSRKKSVRGRPSCLAQWIKFDSLHDAARFLERNTNQKANFSHIGAAARRGYKYHGWEFKYVT